MSATLIDGKQIAATIRQETAVGVGQLREQGITPGLATVLLGDDPASHSLGTFDKVERSFTACGTSW